MAQPSRVPEPVIGSERRVLLTPAAEMGRPIKPAMMSSPTPSTGARRGAPGPDAGYALKLAHDAMGECVLTPGESSHDVELGVALLAVKRAALAGRAPIRLDLEAALDLFDFRGAATHEVVASRRTRFNGVAHSYERQRTLVDSVPDGELRQPTEFTAPSGDHGSTL
jgi:hypothetical protein